MIYIIPGDGIRTHDFLKLSLLPKPFEHGYLFLPALCTFIFSFIFRQIWDNTKQDKLQRQIFLNSTFFRSTIYLNS